MVGGIWNGVPRSQLGNVIAEGEAGIGVRVGGDGTVWLRMGGAEEELGGEGGFLCICGPQAVRPGPKASTFSAPRAPRKYQGARNSLPLAGGSESLCRL